MAKYGSYGWTPDQMARINARRAAQGQEELVNIRDQEVIPQRARSTSSIPVAPAEQDKTKSLKERMAENTADLKKKKEEEEIAFRRKFAPSGTSQIQKSVQMQTAGLRGAGGIKSGLSSPSISRSFGQMVS